MEFYIIHNSEVVVYLELTRFKYCLEVEPLSEWARAVCLLIFIFLVYSLPSGICKKFIYRYKNLKFIGNCEKLVL